MQSQLITITLAEYQHLQDGLAEISSLRSEIEALHRDVALDRQRIAKLENHKPEPRNRDRGEVLAALIIKNGGSIPRQEARRLMHLSEPQFSQLLKVSKDFITITKSHRDKRIKILRLK